MKLTLLVLLLAQVAPIHDASWGEREWAKARTHTPLPRPRRNPTNRVADSADAARLGQRLFFDARFSANGSVACASCHAPDLGFADGKSLSMGLARTVRHSPSLWNVAQQRWFFWDGRADSLWAQAVQPLENPKEMGFDRVSLARALRGDATLRAEYEQLFGALPDVASWPERAAPGDDASERAAAWKHMSADEQRAASRVAANFGKALEAYERRLVRDDAPFDRFVAGDATALSESAQRGWKLFAGRGNCRSCHSGPAFTDGEFHNIGIPPLAGGEPEDPARYAGIDLVREDPFNAQGEFSDAREGDAALELEVLERTPQNFGEYRTPSLRNVALTAPYMHEGQMKSLADVVHFYSTLEGATQIGHHQEQVLQPLKLSASEAADLVAFLESLTGTPPPAALLAPLEEKR
ncbi:MAG: cytochrome-c peroxidase [Planctomycetota bacterium]